VPFEHNIAFGTAQDGCRPRVRLENVANDPANEFAWKTIRRMNAGNGRSRMNAPRPCRANSFAGRCTHAQCLGVHKIPSPNVCGTAQSCDSILAPIQDSHPEYKIDFTTAHLWSGQECRLRAEQAARKTTRRRRTVETRLKRRGNRMAIGVCQIINMSKGHALHRRMIPEHVTSKGGTQYKTVGRTGQLVRRAVRGEPMLERPSHSSLQHTH
jgi:hypothetical protein